MNIAFLIIGLIALWILRSIAANQHIIASNQVKLGEILKHTDPIAIEILSNEYNDYGWNE